MNYGASSCDTFYYETSLTKSWGQIFVALQKCKLQSRIAQEVETLKERIGTLEVRLQSELLALRESVARTVSQLSLSLSFLSLSVGLRFSLHLQDLFICFTLFCFSLLSLFFYLRCLLSFFFFLFCVSFHPSSSSALLLPLLLFHYCLLSLVLFVFLLILNFLLLIHHHHLLLLLLLLFCFPFPFFISFFHCSFFLSSSFFLSQSQTRSLSLNKKYICLSTDLVPTFCLLKRRQRKKIGGKPRRPKNMDKSVRILVATIHKIGVNM